jgi:hypothetical protein
MNPKYEIGDRLVFMKNLNGVLRVKAGDTAEYVGRNQARILTGESKGQAVTLTLDSPVLRREKN